MKSGTTCEQDFVQCLCIHVSFSLLSFQSKPVNKMFSNHKSSWSMSFSSKTTNHLYVFMMIMSSIVDLRLTLPLITFVHNYIVTCVILYSHYSWAYIVSSHDLCFFFGRCVILDLFTSADEVTVAVIYNFCLW